MKNKKKMEIRETLFDLFNDHSGEAITAVFIVEKQETRKYTGRAKICYNIEVCWDEYHQVPDRPMYVKELKRQVKNYFVRIYENKGRAVAYFYDSNSSEARYLFKYNLGVKLKEQRISYLDKGCYRCCQKCCCC